MSAARPIYKTEQNGREERAVVALFERAWGCVATKLPARDRIDYLLRRGEEDKAYMEIKCRRHVYGTYPTYMIATNKFVDMKTVGLSSEKPVILAVSFAGIVRWVDCMKIDPNRLEITKGGRYDRKDEADVEWVVHIPIDVFREIKR